MPPSATGPDPRVLMLCYYYPPILTAGTQRTVRFADGLRETGWKPIVLTVKESRNRWERTGERTPSGVETERSVEWDLQGLILALTGLMNRACDALRLKRRPSLFYNLCVPDLQVAWFSTARGVRLARTCDCVYVSCSPFSSALSGCFIKLLTGKPLVLDFRDAWSLNPHSNAGAIRKRITAVLERFAVRMCDALVLNTLGAERLYREQYPEYARKMTCIPNGFDALNVPDSPERADRFVIMHVGDFYRSRTPDRLLEALAAIRDPRIEFVQVGPVFPSYEKYRDRVSIRIIDRVPHADALRLMRSASLLYLSQGFEAGISDYIAVASKTYEYLATGLPILADCPPGDNADIVARYGRESHVITTQDHRDIEAAVRTAAARPRAAATPQPEFIEKFNGRALTGHLARVLADVSRNGSRPASEPAVDACNSGSAAI